MQFVDVDVRGPVAKVTLCSPLGNRINFAMRAELKQAFERVGDSSARCLLVGSTGADFSLGGDVREWPGIASSELRLRIEVFAAALGVLEGLPIPTIAAVQGNCMGGGFELALACDMIIAERSARFSFPEARLGIMTLQGGVYRLAQRVGSSKALEIVLLSQVVSAEELVRMGVVNRRVDDCAAADSAMSVARELASGPAPAFAATKQLLRIWKDGGLRSAQAALYELSMPLFDAPDVQLAVSNAAKAAEGELPLAKQTFL